MTLHALQTLFDDRLFAAELVAEFVSHGRATALRQRNRLDLFLVERTGEDFEQFGVDRHRRRSVSKGCSVAELLGGRRATWQPRRDRLAQDVRCSSFVSIAGMPKSLVLI